MLTLLGTQLSHLGVCCVCEQVVVLIVLQADAVSLTGRGVKPFCFYITPSAVQQTFKLFTKLSCRIFKLDDFCVCRHSFQNDLVEHLFKFIKLRLVDLIFRFKKHKQKCKPDFQVCKHVGCAVVKLNSVCTQPVQIKLAVFQKHIFECFYKSTFIIKIHIFNPLNVALHNPTQHSVIC